MKKLLIAMMLASIVSAVSAQTLRVVLWYEADPRLPEELALELSEAVIQGALDACFESGVIGTNDRPQAGSLVTTLAYKPGKESIEGFVDYELVVFADLMKNGANYKAPDCTYRLIRVSGLATRYEAVLPALPAASAVKADVDKVCMLMGAEMTRTSLRGR
ncbi:MAG: hypothetical protein A3J97_08325 [Spirochaetes bacterium RIFOXYC1_FULL_54_7]|nr:MAG: hypothetical protein A3J97_08325 [Spirochaetes bacterium RIFOXYC1_FULL_54_7]